MTPLHILALAIAAILFVACELMGTRCSDKMAENAYQLSHDIIIGVMAHAGHSMLKKHLAKKDKMKPGGNVK